MIPTKPLETNWQFFQRQLETSALPVALEACLMRAASASQSENPPVGGEAGEWEVLKPDGIRRFKKGDYWPAGSWEPDPAKDSDWLPIYETHIGNIASVPVRRKRPTVSAQEGARLIENTPHAGHPLYKAYRETFDRAFLKDNKDPNECFILALEAVNAQRQPTVPASYPEVREGPSANQEDHEMMERLIAEKPPVVNPPASQPTEGEPWEYAMGEKAENDKWERRNIQFYSHLQHKWDDLNDGEEGFEETILYRRRKPVEPSAGVASSETPTPETDDAARKGAYLTGDGGDYAATFGKQLVHIDFARNLERQRNAALADVKTLRITLDGTRQACSEWERVAATTKAALAEVGRLKEETLLYQEMNRTAEERTALCRGELAATKAALSDEAKKCLTLYQELDEEKRVHAAHNTNWRVKCDNDMRAIVQERDSLRSALELCRKELAAAQERVKELELGLERKDNILMDRHTKAGDMIHKLQAEIARLQAQVQQSDKECVEARRVANVHYDEVLRLRELPFPSPWTRITADPESRPKAYNSNALNEVLWRYPDGACRSARWDRKHGIQGGEIPIAWMPIPPLPAVVQEPDAFEKWLNIYDHDFKAQASTDALRDAFLAGQASVKEDKPQES